MKESGSSAQDWKTSKQEILKKIIAVKKFEKFSGFPDFFKKPEDAFTARTG
jgi:hypothetical protein